MRNCNALPAKQRKIHLPEAGNTIIITVTPLEGETG